MRVAIAGREAALPVETGGRAFGDEITALDGIGEVYQSPFQVDPLHSRMQWGALLEEEAPMFVPPDLSVVHGEAIPSAD